MSSYCGVDVAPGRCVRGIEPRRGRDRIRGSAQGILNQPSFHRRGFTRVERNLEAARAGLVIGLRQQTPRIESIDTYIRFRYNGI